MKDKEKQQLAFSRGEVPTVIRVMQGILVLSGIAYLACFLTWSLANLTWLGLTFTPVARAFFERVDVIPAP